MKRTLTQAIMTLAFLTATICLQAQVTIGSNLQPNAGALLDLKQDGTTSKGLAMPRVILTERNKLYPMLSSGYASTEDAAHTGLLVYHTDRCTMDGKGLYIWDGTEWQALHEPSFPELLTFNQDYFDLPSGQDARPLTTQNLTVSWDAALAAPTWGITSSTGFSAVPFTLNPLLPTVFTSTPTTMALLPNTMSAAEVNSNQWRTKESKLIFTYDGCPQAVTLNQTNYSLRISDKIYVTVADADISIQGNATWNVSSIANTSGVATISPSTGGQTLKAGSGATSSTTYNVGTGRRYNITDVTFADAELPKRMKDVTVSVLNCNNSDNDLTIAQWAEQIGFTTAEIAAVTQVTPSGIKNGNQLHKDQNNNLFISGSFGATAGRWMLHNVRASTFDATRSDGTTVISPNIITESYSENYPNPQMGFPNINGTTNATDVTLYNRAERLGRLYNWAATTMKKGGASGRVDFDEREVLGNENHPKVQGICPNGWHVPSDKEWTTLENELNTNTSAYSTLIDINGTIVSGAIYNRGTHGQAMKDQCPLPAVSILSNGKSNIYLSPITGGFNVLLTGFGASGSTRNLGGQTYFWTASGAPSSNAWYRLLSSGSPSVNRHANPRHALYSVRCKKD